MQLPANHWARQFKNRGCQSYQELQTFPILAYWADPLLSFGQPNLHSRFFYMAELNSQVLLRSE